MRSNDPARRAAVMIILITLVARRNFYCLILLMPRSLRQVQAVDNSIKKSPAAWPGIFFIPLRR